MRALWLIFAFVFIGLAQTANAHEIRPGYLQITQVEQTPENQFNYTVTWKAPIRLGAPLAVTPEFLTLCEIDGPAAHDVSAFAITTTTNLQCQNSIKGSAVLLRGLDATLTDVLVRFQPFDGKQQTLRATASEPYVTITENPSRWDVAKTYSILGVEHIWFGFDHLLFVLGLVLLITGTRRIVETITAFTIAHSVTLVATTLGWVSLPIAPVEAVIALSIVFLAVEVAKKSGDAPSFASRKPWIVAAAFGLLHGFGFASALSNIGMPEKDVPTALLTFNLGVEFGQLAFVAGLLIALYIAQRVRLRRPTEIMASYFIGALAMFWLIERVI